MAYNYFTYLMKVVLELI